MKIFVGGATQYVGRVLTESLRADQHEVVSFPALAKPVPAVNLKARRALARPRKAGEGDDDEGAGGEGDGDDELQQGQDEVGDDQDGGESQDATAVGGGEGGNNNTQDGGADGSDASSEQQLRNLIRTCDVVILDLVRDAAVSEDVLKALQDLRDEEMEKPINVIGLSTVLTWDQSRKTKRKGVRERDYLARKPATQYTAVKALETFVLAAQDNNINVVSTVVAPGVVYGCGEEAFAALFRAAWMCELATLPIIGDGRNYIPTVHVRDLASIVQAVLFSPPESRIGGGGGGSGDDEDDEDGGGDVRYIVAVDKSQLTQKQIVQAIASGVGLGKCVTLTRDSDTAVAGTFGERETMLADLRFERVDEDEGDGGAMLPGPSDWLEQLEFTWVSPNGIASAIDVVRREFAAARNLRPVRMMLHGPPASGKTYYAERLAQKLYLPHIKVGDVIAEALARNDAVSDKMKQLLDAQNDDLKKKNKKSGGAGGKQDKKTKARSKQRGLRQLARARIPPRFLARLVRDKLRSAPCRNKGFVLDGFPRTAVEARALFRERIPDDVGDGDGDGGRGGDGDGDGDAADDAQALQEAEDEMIAMLMEGDGDGGDGGDGAGAGEEEEDPDNQTTRVDQTTMVDRVIVLDVSPRTAAARLALVPDDRIVVGHNDEDGYARRAANFAVINDPNAEVSMSPLDGELRAVEPLMLPAVDDANAEAGVAVDSAEANERAMAMFMRYLTAVPGGEAYNFHPTDEERAAAAMAAEAAAAETAERLAAEAQERRETEQAARAAQNSRNMVRQAQVLVEDQELVEACSLPLRTYLMDNVIPALVDGLLDTCKVQPVDPVDFLAEYLFKYSVGAPPAPAATAASATAASPSSEV